LLVFTEESIAIFHDLMASTDQVEVVFLEEFLELLPTEDKSTPSLIFLPIASILIWVIPKKVSD
jgi:hypothetical protein